MQVIEYIPFIQPVLKSDNVLGGEDFAVWASSVHGNTQNGSYYAWHPFGTGDWAASGVPKETPYEYIFYNPNPINITDILVENRHYANDAMTVYTFEGSNDFKTWDMIIADGANEEVASAGKWNMPLADNKGYYKYHKISIIEAAGGDTGFYKLTLTATEQIVVERWGKYYRKTAPYAYKTTEKKYYRLQDWTMPVLSEDGVVGGDSYACQADSPSPSDANPKMYAYNVFDGSTDTYFDNNNNIPCYLTFYSPYPLVLSNANITAYTNAYTFDIVIQGSENNQTWYNLSQKISFTEADQIWDIPLSGNRAFQYFRIYCDKASGSDITMREVVFTGQQLVEIKNYDSSVIKTKTNVVYNTRVKQTPKYFKYKRYRDKYIELVSVQPSGNAYFITDYVVNPATTRIEYTCTFDDVSGTECLFCSRSPGTSNSYTAFLIGDNIRFDYNTAQHTSSGTIGLVANKRYTVVMDKDAEYINDTLVFTNTVTAPAPTTPLTFLASYEGEPTSSTGNYAKYILHGVKIYEDGVLVRDYIPVINPDDVDETRPEGAVSLYDKVTDSFAINSIVNAATFIPGDKVFEESETEGDFTVNFCDIEFMKKDNYGGGVIFRRFIQPKLTADGGFGGDKFATKCSSHASGREAYKAFDGNLGTKWGKLNTATDGWLTFYNPNPLRVISIDSHITTDYPGEDGGNLEVFGSNDNINWVSLWSGSYEPSVNFSMDINSKMFYNYHKILLTEPLNAYAGLGELQINAVEKIKG